MKRILTHILLMVSVIQIGTLETAAQAQGNSRILNPSLYREKLYLFTDRNLYASGEKVRFRLYDLSHPLLKESNWSRVFYLELVNSRNAAVARGKYKLHAWGGDGQIMIPDTASTGQYYLRAYTSWMRNYPPSEYVHLPLAIVNPARIGSENLSAAGNGSQTSEVTRGSLDEIACSSDKTSYGKREKVTVRIQPENGGASPDGYCISVIKKGTLDEAFYYATAPNNGDPLRLNDLAYYPETMGATLSGTVLLGEGQEPADRALLGVTMLGSDPDYMEYMTDKQGRFLIPVPRQTGNHDALVTVRSARDEAVKIQLNEAFSTDFSTAPIPVADFFGERRALVEEVMVNAQLRSAFELTDRDPVDARQTDPVDAGESDPEVPFYGIPEFRYRTDDYVALPDLEEFFFEIVQQLQVEKYEDHTDMAVLNDRDEVIPIPPLILLDYVPVADFGDLLPVSPRLVDYVDIVNRIYVRGGHSYGGIVSIITTRGDRAGVALPGGSAFISYTGLSDLRETAFPDYKGAVRKDRIPDLRNTLYWEARYEITPEDGGSFAFFTSDVTGEFIVVVRGMTSDGKVLSGSCTFMVK